MLSNLIRFEQHRTEAMEQLTRLEGGLNAFTNQWTNMNMIMYVVTVVDSILKS
jgi:hypothetical protein